MIYAFALMAISVTRVDDDPFQSFTIIESLISQESDSGEIIYTSSDTCTFVSMQHPMLVSSRLRGAREADTFFQFDIRYLYRKGCDPAAESINFNRGTYIGGMAADVSVKRVVENCAITLCSQVDNVSIRLTKGLVASDDMIAVKFGDPYARSFVAKVSLDDYKHHRSAALK
jgi:hypothetical protein